MEKISFFKKEGDDSSLAILEEEGQFKNLHYCSTNEYEVVLWDNANPDNFPLSEWMEITLDEAERRFEEVREGSFPYGTVRYLIQQARVAVEEEKKSKQQLSKEAELSTVQPPSERLSNYPVPTDYSGIEVFVDEANDSCFVVAEDKVIVFSLTEGEAGVSVYNLHEAQEESFEMDDIPEEISKLTEYGEEAYLNDQYKSLEDMPRDLMERISSKLSEQFD